MLPDGCTCKKQTLAQLLEITKLKLKVTHVRLSSERKIIWRLTSRVASFPGDAWTLKLSSSPSVQRSSAWSRRPWSESADPLKMLPSVWKVDLCPVVCFLLILGKSFFISLASSCSETRQTNQNDSKKIGARPFGLRGLFRLCLWTVFRLPNGLPCTGNRETLPCSTISRLRPCIQVVQKNNSTPQWRHENHKLITKKQKSKINQVYF